MSDTTVHVIARTQYNTEANGGRRTTVEIRDDLGTLLACAESADSSVSPAEVARLALAQMAGRLASAMAQVEACGLKPRTEVATLAEPALAPKRGDRVRVLPNIPVFANERGTVQAVHGGNRFSIILDFNSGAYSFTLRELEVIS